MRAIPLLLILGWFGLPVHGMAGEPAAEAPATRSTPVEGRFDSLWPFVDEGDFLARFSPDLFTHLTDGDYVLTCVFVPSFSQAWIVSVKRTGEEGRNRYTAVVRRYSGETNHGTSIWETITSGKRPTYTHTEREKVLNPALAQRLMQIWKTELRRVTKPPPMLGLDGTQIYYGYSSDAADASQPERLLGETWSPDEGSRAAQLVAW